MSVGRVIETRRPRVVTITVCVAWVAAVVACGPSVADAVIVPCGDSTNRIDEVPNHLTVFFEAIALPSPLELQLNPAPVVDATDLPFFAKQGLLVRSEEPITVGLASGSNDGVAIGWGSPATPTQRLEVGGCGVDEWWVFTGGYWSDEPRCIELDVTLGDEGVVVPVGLGMECPTD